MAGQSGQRKNREDANIRPWDRAGITQRQYDYWARSGLVPDLIQQPGTGRYREPTDMQVKYLTNMGLLVRAGVTPRLASRVTGHGQTQVDKLLDLIDGRTKDAD